MAGLSSLKQHTENPVHCTTSFGQEQDPDIAQVHCTSAAEQSDTPCSSPPSLPSATDNSYLTLAQFDVSVDELCDTSTAGFRSSDSSSSLQTKDLDELCDSSIDDSSPHSPVSCNGSVLLSPMESKDSDTAIDNCEPSNLFSVVATPLSTTGSTAAFPSKLTSPLPFPLLPGKWYQQQGRLFETNRVRSEERFNKD